MRHLYLAFCVLGAAASSAFASLTVHLQSPFGVAATTYSPHVVENASEPVVGATSSTLMKSESDNWYSYTFKKSLSDFKGSETLSFKGCTEDSKAACVAWPQGTDINIYDLFEGSSEVWIYTDEETGDYTKSFAAPGSKIVWFKSPWGNKALPQMVFAEDTIVMHFSEDETKCGWFYGAISPEMLEGRVLQMAYFTRFKAPWLTVPESKNAMIDLSTALSKKDTIYVDGTEAVPSAGIKMGKVGDCFDKSRTLHIYNPWRNNSVYRDSTVYVTIDGVWEYIKSIVEKDTTFGPAQTGLAFDKDYKFWLSLNFSDSIVSSAAWKSEDAKVQITRSFTERNITAQYFSEKNRPVASDLFPSGVYETWFFTSSTMEDLDLSYAPLEPKVVRLLSPWKNTPTSFIVDANNDVVRMSTFSKDTCGWFEGTYYKHAPDWKVYFKQSFGLEKYALEGVVKASDDVEGLINLDSLMSEHDTAWVYPHDKSYSSPEASAKFPNKLGECPSMKISARFYDWAGEHPINLFPEVTKANQDSIDSIDVDFGNVLNGNKYTTVGDYKSCSAGTVTGMVRDTLVDGVPARVDSTDFPWDKCAAAHEIEKWFKPEFIQLDPTTGDSLTNLVCKDIELQLDNDGFWYADYTNEEGNCNDPVSPGFFPLDNFKYLDTKDTVGNVPNPKFDWDVPSWTWYKANLNNGDGTDTCRHNYSYTMAVSASFKYVKGQYFEFRGDDDVWVYINNRLVVDIGGVHDKVEGAVNLDTIGQGNPKYKLTEGREYSFHIFYAERNQSGSNFKMRTSINLQKQNTYLPIVKQNSKSSITGILKLKMDSKAISCDPRATSVADTSDAPSVFYLAGGNLSETKELSVGINFAGGIIINADKAGFEINIDEIVKQRSLSPGTYTLYYFLEEDMSLNDSYEFTVPEYPMPEIAFVDVFSEKSGDKLTAFDPKNKNLKGETIVVGENDTLMTHVRYPEIKYIEVMVTYMGNICEDCNVVLDLVPSDRNMIFYDETEQQMNTVITDDKGLARFYVIGDAPMKGASFSVVGVSGVQNQLKWENINFKDPEIPLAKTGEIYDRNGDGVPDSIYVPFEFNAFKKHELDSIAWNFGSKDWHEFSMDKISDFVKNDSTVIITADSLIDSVLTGASKSIIEGNFLYQYIYEDDATISTQMSDVMVTKIQERIGAIMLEKPMLKIMSDNVVKVTVKLSEACNTSGLGNTRFIELKDKNDEIVDPATYKILSYDPSGESDYYDLVFQKSTEYIIPEVGFKIRLLPGVLPDKLGNTPHKNNPWRRIEGEQPLETERPKVVTVNPGMFEDNPWPGDTNDVIAVRVDPELTLKEVIQETGLPGVLVKFQLNDYATTLLLSKADSATRDEILSKVKVRWDIEFFSSLGQYVNWVKGEFACNDKSVYGTDCIQNAGNMFFEWDAMSDKGRMVGTGVYIAKFKFKIFSDSEIVGKGEETFTFGIRRNEKYKHGTKKIK